MCATYFELTYPVVQNICDKNTRGNNVLQTSLVIISVILIMFTIQTTELFGPK